MMNSCERFGENVFNDAVMQKRLPKETYKALKRTIEGGQSLDPEIAGRRRQRDEGLGAGTRAPPITRIGSNR